jgi:ribonucleoside-diphosphate reductase beta chain
LLAQRAKKLNPMSTMPPKTTTNAIAKDDVLSFQDADLVVREEGDFIIYQIGPKAFRLNKSKARERLSGKRVINGHRSAELNVLPLKYHEAYRIYKQMKANHWEPDVIDMTRDVQQWNTGTLTPKERWIIEMGVGYFSAAEGIVGDSVLHVIEENLTAAELKHASLRQIAEESIHMDSLLHIIGSLNMDIDEVTARFSDIPSVLKRMPSSRLRCRN